MPKWSWFFRGFCQYLDHIRPHLRIREDNPLMVSFLKDPWCFEVPISLRPTFLNVDYVDNDFAIADLILNSNWNFIQISNLLSIHLASPLLILLQFVLKKTVRSGIIILMVTPLSLLFISSSFTVRGFMIIGLVRKTSRIFWLPPKQFLWCFLHCKVKTPVFLHNVNVSHDMTCGLCGLSAENIPHLFENCCKT